MVKIYPLPSRVSYRFKKSLSHRNIRPDRCIKHPGYVLHLHFEVQLFLSFFTIISTSLYFETKREKTSERELDGTTKTINYGVDVSVSL